MMPIREMFLLIAMLTVFIPVGMALCRYKFLNPTLKALLCFLAFSFLFDVKHYIPCLKPYAVYFYVSFGLLQFLFYLWFLKRTAAQLHLFRHYNLAIVSFILLWCLCYAPRAFDHDVLWQRSIFEVSQGILLSTLSAYALMELTKSEQMLYGQLYFWFFLGIFIYFFMTVFLYAFMHAPFRDSIWPYHSIFDILKNLLFSVGFLVATRRSGNKTSQF